MRRVSTHILVCIYNGDHKGGNNHGAMNFGATRPSVGSRTGRMRVRVGATTTENPFTNDFSSKPLTSMVESTPPTYSTTLKNDIEKVEEVVEKTGLYVGIFGPRDSKYWPLWTISMTLLANLVSLVLLDVYYLESSWALVQSLPIVWFLQGYFVLECVHISGTEIREQTTRGELTRCLLSGILATFFLVSCVFPLVVMELEQCGSLEDTAAEQLRECYEAVSTSISADFATTCQMHSDIMTRATGICPEVRFGSGSGTAWKAWTMITILLFILLNCLAIWKLPRPR